jgi:phosphoribosylamine---glycine ligase
MRIGVLGSGGREHALVWALSRSRREPDVVALPGNGGTVRNIAVDPLDPDDVARAAREARLDLLIVGGEEPLARGVCDRLSGTETVPFGPTASAARLETSKVWAKRFLDRHGIPTAEWSEAKAAADAERAAQRWGRVVVKADGLAAGKGVVVCDGEQSAFEAWDALRRSRPEGEPILVEQALAGWELSILCLTDGRAAALFPPARDHKAVFDGGRGPNTGGMGAYAPAPQCTTAVRDEIVRRVVEPTLAGLRQDGVDYCGFLYFGLMMTADGPRVLEYNARLGDPEAEVLLPLLACDLLEGIEACAARRLRPEALAVRPEAAVDVVLAAGGYPGPYRTGEAITGLDAVDRNVLVFHGATRRAGIGWETAGGRVVHVVGRGRTVGEAAEAAYENADRIQFAGRHLRRDIGRGVA